MFVGNNLTDIRILHGLTRKQLAQHLEVTEQAVWQYENGYAAPKMEVINKLKSIFNVRSRYFYKNDTLNNYKRDVVHHNHVAYRSSVANSARKTQFESAHMEKVIAFLEFISSRLQFPVNMLRELRDKVINMLNVEDDREECISRAAAYAREFLGMNQYDNDQLLFLLEKNGAFIFEKTIEDKIDAYSLWSLDDDPYIMLGNLKKSAVRRNFDLAHELGHLLMHYKVEFALLDKKSLREYEHEANLFAGEFLMPQRKYIEEFKSISRISHPDSYIELKRKWKVSIQALAFRAHYLKLISYQQYRYFLIKLNKLHYKGMEPLDKELAVPRPGKLRSILQLLFENQYLSLDELLNTMEVDIDYLTNLTGIERNFFRKYRQEDVKQFSVQDLNVKAN